MQHALEGQNLNQGSLLVCRSAPRLHDAAVHDLAVHILALHRQQLQAHDAAVHQQRVADADIFNEAVVIDADAPVGAVGALLDGERVVLACADARQLVETLAGLCLRDSCAMSKGFLRSQDVRSVL